MKYSGKKLFDNIIDSLDNHILSLAEKDYANLYLEWCENSMFYDVDLKSYHVYDGKHFKKDIDALLLKKDIQQFIIELVSYAIPKNVDGGIIIKLYNQKVLKNTSLIAEALKIETRTETRKINQYDNLFNTQNGILNLDTKELLPHSTKYLITHLANVEYKPELGEVDNEAKEILLSFFLNDENVLNFMFEFLGMCLHGDAGIRKFIYAYGSGRNGKSTFFNFFTNSFFGNYATTANFQAFTGIRDNTRASSDLVPLFDKRLVLANEAQTQHKLNTNLIKSITGGDNINARLNFKDEQPFQPHCKLVMFGNNQLEISDSSEGMQDRYVQIPFKAKFNNTRTQKEIWDILEKNKPQILNSLLAGYQRVKTNKFSKVESITEASLSGFVASNTFVRFKNEYLVKEENSQVTMKDVYIKYKEFADNEDMHSKDRLNKNSLIEHLRSSGCKVVHQKQDILKDFIINNETFF